MHSKDVAIKRVRYRLHDDLTFLKVIHYFYVESLMLTIVDILANGSGAPNMGSARP